jgi:hypothetical protein
LVTRAVDVLLGKIVIDQPKVFFEFGAKQTKEAKGINIGYAIKEMRTLPNPNVEEIESSLTFIGLQE